MNLKSIRRIIILSVLVASALAGTAAQADPLPIVLVSPSDSATVSYDDTFLWDNDGADSYIVKFKIVATGQKLKQTVDGIVCCATQIGLSYMQSPLLKVVKDGQAVSWKVVGKHGAEKTKSPKRTLIVNTVEAPALVLPANGHTLTVGQSLGWTTSPINQSYTLVVKDAASGIKIINESIQDGACALSCVTDPRELADLQHGLTFKWFVKAVGFNGETAKSAKRTFTASNASPTR